jgi:sugar O-acyltransferase (sialic acid O-acetyltransferase NeuD family)
VLIEILGAGGHAKVVIEALLAKGHAPQCIRVRDDRLSLAETQLMGCQVVVPTLPLDPEVGLVHAAVGSGAVRRRWLSECLRDHQGWATILHPMSSISPSALVGEGSFVAALALIGPDARVGRSTIINHGASVDHDCTIGSFVHLAPRSTLCGGVTVGDDVLIGAGAVILPGVRVGRHCIVGAGAVVADDVPEGTTVIGIPAKALLDPT